MYDLYNNKDDRDGRKFNTSPFIEKKLALGASRLLQAEETEMLSGQVSLDLAISDRLTVDSKSDGSVVLNYIGDNESALDVTRSAEGVIQFTYSPADGKQDFTYTSDGQSFVIPSKRFSR